VCVARNPPPLPLPKSPKDKELSSSSSLLAHITPESPTKYARHSRAESMKLDQLYFSRQRAHSPSASMSKMSSSPTIPQSFSSSSSHHDLSSIADQLNTISTTTTSVLTTLQTLMRRSKDNASELDNLRKQVLESKDKDSQTVDEIKRLLSSTNSTTDLTALYAKLDALRPNPQTTSPPPSQPVSTHKLDEEKAVVENILANANQALTHLLTLTESINNLTSHLQTTTTRLSTEESRLEALQARKSTLEVESARLEATIHLRNLELASFTKKAEILESRILRAKTAVQLSGSKHIKMKKSPLIVGPGKPILQSRETPITPVSPQRRILSLSSTSNKGSPARSVTEFPSNSGRKTSWSKRIGGMLSGLTNSNNKENAGDNSIVESVKGGGESIKSGKKKYILENDGEITESGVLGLSVPAVATRGRSVSERKK
jgi:hypothetical protein